MPYRHPNGAVTWVRLPDLDLNDVECVARELRRGLFAGSAHKGAVGERTHDNAMDYAGGVNEEIANPDAATDRPRVTVADLRRFADSVRDLDDRAVMARAWQ